MSALRCASGSLLIRSEPVTIKGKDLVSDKPMSDKPMSDKPMSDKPTSDGLDSGRPSALFVCVHNAGRSQMAAGFLTHLAGGRVDVRSAGSLPGDQVNPSAVAAMAEVGIDISGHTPKVLTTDHVQASDVVITMGCGDACPIFPGKRYLDWDLEDPAGRDVEAVRPIRDEIEARVKALLVELLPTPPTAG